MNISEEFHKRIQNGLKSFSNGTYRIHKKGKTIARKIFWYGKWIDANTLQIWYPDVSDLIEKDLKGRQEK